MKNKTENAPFWLKILIWLRIVLIIVALFLVLAMCGCSMSRWQLRRVEKSNIEQRADVKETTLTEIETSETERKEEKTGEQKTEIEQTTTIKWSVPDSSGRQFPTETTTKNKITITGKQTDVSEEKHTDYKSARAESKEDRSVVNANTEIKTAEATEKKPAAPAWITWVAVILSLGVIVLVYLILKRYRIIK